MSSDSSRNRPETDAADSITVGDVPRVLLFMDAGRNRDLLLETLGERYEVRTTTDVKTLETGFDCCVFDQNQFNRVAGTVQSKRDTSDPVFLPFVLLVGEDTTDSAIRDAREYVDDVIELPTKKADLLSRISNLVERRRTAAELAEREAQLEQTVADLELKERAMDEAPVGITITDPDREDNPMIYANSRFETLTGHSDVIGENCRFLQGEETDPETRATIREAVDECRPVSVDILNYRKNGQKFWNRLDIAPVHDEEGTVTSFVGFQMEITERKIRERRLEVLKRVLSHNLRNKMNVIEGHVSLLKREYEKEPPESLTKIESAAADLIGLADSVRRIEQAFPDNESTEPLELTERLEQLISAFKDRFPDTEINLTYSDADTYYIDVPGFIAAIEEAVENAVRHNDSLEPAVEIRVNGRGADWIDVEIEDNGPGIPDQELSVLRTGETSLHHADRLGIWFMYWVVSRVGGEFSVTESEPRGTTVRLSVPRHTEE
ncbi:PAS domain-containing protein [Halovenus marina]|uniref:PAS domain-containing protein n=1 Tax=Halovenus marina TaxID=3396621 RepID=UPI003F54EBA1